MSPSQEPQKQIKDITPDTVIKVRKLQSCVFVKGETRAAVAIEINA